MPDEVPVIFSDDALIVVNKPAGLLSVPGRGPERQDCVAARTQAVFPDARVVHRLDQATSGLMILARGANAQRALSAAFERRQVGKRYVAIVTGLMVEDSGCIDLALAADWPNRPRQQVDAERGKASFTRWQVLERHAVAGTSRLELEPLTGRSHQLRVHLMAIGHAIVGDALYAPALVAPRLMLHASALTIAHPVEARPLNFSSAAPF